MNFILSAFYGTLALLAFTVPIVFAAGVMDADRLPKWLKWPAALSIATATYVGLYLLYKTTSFPPWMRWIDQLFR